MAKYNVVFLIKDKYGHEKELVGGAIDINLNEVTSGDAEVIAEALNLDEYVTDEELATAVEDLPTIETVKEIVKSDVHIAIEENKDAHKAVAEIVETHVDTIKYGSFSNSRLDKEECCNV